MPQRQQNRYEACGNFSMSRILEGSRRVLRVAVGAQDVQILLLVGAAGAQRRDVVHVGRLLQLSLAARALVALFLDHFLAVRVGDVAMFGETTDGRQVQLEGFVFVESGC